MDGDASEAAERSRDRSDHPARPGRPSRSRRPPAARRSRRRSPRVPGWSVPLLMVGVLLVGEVGARIVGPNIPRKAGSEERAYVKADQMYARSGRTDVVFLGSSESAGGLIPKQVLAEVPALRGGYNAALPGAQLTLDREWVDRVVFRALHPKVVVIGMLPTTIIDFAKTKFDPAEKTGPAYRSAFELIDPGGLGSFGWKLRQYSALVRYRPYLRQPTLLWDGLRNTATGGWEHRTLPPGSTNIDWETETDPEVIKDNTEPDGEVLDYRDESVPGDNTTAVLAFTAAGSQPYGTANLAALVRTIRRHGAAPAIAIGPLDRRTLVDAGANLEGVDRLSAVIRAWGDAHGVPVLDQSRTNYPADQFHDRQHVDADGAEVWSGRVGRFLADACRRHRLGDAC